MKIIVTFSEPKCPCHLTWIAGEQTMLLCNANLMSNEVINIDGAKSECMNLEWAESEARKILYEIGYNVGKRQHPGWTEKEVDNDSV